MALTPTYPVTIIDSCNHDSDPSPTMTDNGYAWNHATNTTWQTSTSYYLNAMTTSSLSWDAVYTPLTLTKMEVLLRWTYDGPNDPQTDTGPIVRASALNSFYMMRMVNHKNKISIAVNAKGEWVNLKDIAFDMKENHAYWLRFRCDETGLHAKAWEIGTREPTGWTLDAPYYQGPNAPAKGGMGFCTKKTETNYTSYVYQVFGYTLSDVAVARMPLQDTFTRDRVDSWDFIPGTTNSVWRGHATLEPEVYPETGYRFDISAASDTGTILVGADGDIEYMAITGASYGSGVENLVKFRMGSSSSLQQFRIGLFGAYQTVGGIVQWTGYDVRINGSATHMVLEKKTSMTGSYSTITASTDTAFTAMTTTDFYFIRFQVSGTTLQAKIWKDGTSEPGSFQIVGTDSAIIQGRPWISWSQAPGAVSGRTIEISEITYRRLPLTNSLATGTLSLISATPTSLTLSASYTGDANTNGLVFSYDAYLLGQWQSGNNAGGFTGWSGTRVGSTFQFTTNTDLLPNTTYDLVVLIVDPDGVTNTNPLTGSFTTSNTGLFPDKLQVTAVTATTADLKLTYTADTDNDSTATLSYRTASSLTQTIVDSFSDYSGTLLQAHKSDIADDVVWTKHPTSDATDAIIWGGRVYAPLPINQSQSYYMQNVNPSFEYNVECDVLVSGQEGMIVLGGRVNNTTGAGYFATFDPKTTNPAYLGQTLCTIEKDNPTLVSHWKVLPETPIGEMVHLKFIVRSDYVALELDGVEVVHWDTVTSYTSGTNVNQAGLMFHQKVFGPISQTWTIDNSMQVDNFAVNYRTYGGSWTSAGSMTADRGNHWFTKSVTGLTSDTIYNFRATIADNDGLFYNSQEFVTIMTPGQAVQLTTLAGIPRSTSIVVQNGYLYDTNNNSTITVQYRAVHDYLYSTVPPSLITVNRGGKLFSTTLPLLKPNTTYEVVSTISDPNGIVEGTSAYLKALITTKGVTDPSKQETKHYIWKVYDRDEKYIATWQDAGEPEFAFHENGGVSDLSVVLPRKISDIDSFSSGIAHQNRVDIWCLDPSSKGFGPNMELDPEFDLGAWTLGSNASIVTEGGPDDSSALKIVASVTTQVITRGGVIFLYRQPTLTGSSAYPIPLVIGGVAKSSGKLILFAEAYDKEDTKIDTSDTAETVGGLWQNIQFEYTPPATAKYIRVCAKNEAKGTMYLDKVSVRPKELLIYRGRIESFTPRIEQDGEDVSVEILGLVSLLSDDYIEFLQFVDIQPAKDVGKTTYGASDPSDMLRRAIDQAQRQNPQFTLYYTAESIRSTGTVVEYTFRDQQLRAIMDKIRNLCPSGWHYYIEADGLVNLRGSEHAPTHTLRLGVEIMNFSVEKSIRNLKNYIQIKGRQDEDLSEPDGFGSIKYVAFDQESINIYGKRMLFIRDANIADPFTAEIVGDGRLEEYNREEQRAECYVPDDKSIYYIGGSLRGANIEEFRPGDNVIVIDPVTGAHHSYWDRMTWDKDAWDSSTNFSPLPDPVPIKTVQFSGSYASLELSERQPSSQSDFGRLYRWLQLQDADKGDI